MAGRSRWRSRRWRCRLLDRPRRRGALAGLALAALVTISLEGLPFARGERGRGARLGDRAAADARSARDCSWSAVRRRAGVRLRPVPPASCVPACDAMSPAWLAMLGAAASARRGDAPRRRAHAVAGLALAARPARRDAAALAPGCAGRAVRDARSARSTILVPATCRRPADLGQSRRWSLMTIGFPLVGLVGGVRRAGARAQGEARTRWAIAARCSSPRRSSLSLRQPGRRDRQRARLPARRRCCIAPLRARGVAVASPAGARARRLLAALAGPAAAAIVLCGRRSSRRCRRWSPARSARLRCASPMSRARRACRAATIFAPTRHRARSLASTHHRSIARRLSPQRGGDGRPAAAFTGTPAAGAHASSARAAPIMSRLPGHSTRPTLYARRAERLLGAA